jgi:riboflavin biosynthesis pyrimidine reductase
MSLLRLLLPGPAVVGEIDDAATGDLLAADDVVQALADLYAYPDPLPDGGWMRVNMVSTLDGAATGPDGRTGSINNAADRLTFAVLRGLADVVLVGAGTVRAERYRIPAAKPAFAERRAAAGQAPAPALAVVTRTGKVPVLDGAARGYVITCAAADPERVRATAGAPEVIVAGDEVVDVAAAVAELSRLGLPRVLLEGGPSLLGDAAAAGRVDELCLTISPVISAGEAPRISHGPPADLQLHLAHLAECDQSLLGRWLVRRSAGDD